MFEKIFKKFGRYVPVICFCLLTLNVVAAGYADDLAKPELLEAATNTLKGEAQKLDERVKAFSLHAEKYEKGPLHQSVLRHNASILQKNENFKGGAGKKEQSGGVLKGNASTVDLKEEVPQTQKLSAEEVAEREATINALHAEYEGHVNQLSSLVDSYRNFFHLYANHVDQFQIQVGQLKRYEKARMLAMEKPISDVGSPKLSARLVASEKELDNVLKKMVALEDKGTNLPESVLCPAYDDLQAEFKKALGGVNLVLTDVPKQKVQLVAEREVVQIKGLKLEVEAVERLHSQQESLQKEYEQLKKDYLDIHKRQGQLTEELDKETKAQVELEQDEGK
jgi:hypothetical protein